MDEKYIDENVGDPEWINETDGKQLPEAPMSIHVDSYYKGFHVGWTKRMDEKSLSSQVLGIKAFINILVEDGYKPSWNDDTNEKNGHAETTECKHNSTEVKISNSEKNKGRKYRKCIDCNGFAGWV